MTLSYEIHVGNPGDKEGDFRRVPDTTYAVYEPLKRQRRCKQTCENKFVVFTAKGT